MAERSNAAVLKTVIPSDRDRGFESHSLLQSFLSEMTDRPDFANLSFEKLIEHQFKIYKYPPVATREPGILMRQHQQWNGSYWSGRGIKRNRLCPFVCSILGMQNTANKKILWYLDCVKKGKKRKCDKFVKQVERLKLYKKI